MMTEGAIATDTFAELLGEISGAQMIQLRQMVESAPWREVPGRRYDTAEVKFWDECSRAFFIRIPPGGSIPRHHDVFIPGTTHHLVVETNEGCANCWLDTQGAERSVHMKQGHCYRVAREPLHWATNAGATERVHLLVEYS